MAGRSRWGGGGGLSCLEEEKRTHQEAFTSGEEKRTCGVGVAVIIRLVVSN